MNNEKNVKTIENTSHMVTIDSRKRIMLTGILEVVSSQDKSVICKIVNSVVVVSGNELRVSKLNLEEGLLIVDGVIDGLKYQEKTTGKSIFKRMFK